MTDPVTDPMRAALDLRAALNAEDTARHRTRAGHWHPPGPCTPGCPMSGHGPASARHAMMMAAAAGFPRVNPYALRFAR